MNKFTTGKPIVANETSMIQFNLVDFSTVELLLGLANCAKSLLIFRQYLKR
jgi:hypothetical protein